MNPGLRSHIFLLITLAAIIVTAGCGTAKVPSEQPPEGRDGGEHRRVDGQNLFVSIRDADISNPENDRRSYYRVFIDKVEEGRTSIALESQVKVFDAMVSAERHLVTIEKWALDEKAGKYVKLNNIDQPRPNFVYVEVPADRVVKITVTVIRGAARYTVTID